MPIYYHLTNRELAVLAKLMDEKRVNRGDFYGVGRKTFEALLAKGFIEEPNGYCDHMRITATGKAAYDSCKHSTS